MNYILLIMGIVVFATIITTPVKRLGIMAFLYLVIFGITYLITKSIKTASWVGLLVICWELQLRNEMMRGKNEIEETPRREYIEVEYKKPKDNWFERREKKKRLNKAIRDKEMDMMIEAMAIVDDEDW